MVAEETQACYVEWIELYYDCPLTQQGIVLVDTPGADSINARHTGVAFDYIKNSDAILFVTYYNHAFSQADREFLIQLGRVKDIFTLDKMFFIINAADLAASEQELDTVTQYVEKNLISYGIQQPKTYPVSSQTALAAKHNNDKDLLYDAGMTTFETHFMAFTMNELTNMAVEAASADIRRVHDTVRAYMRTADEDEQTKAAKKQQVTANQENMQAYIAQLNDTAEQHALEQKIDKLLYHVHERLFLRFPDAFKSAFNPSVLHKNMSHKKKTLQACLRELQQFIGFDLAQEMRATSLRIETFTQETLTTWQTGVHQQLQSIDPDVSIAEYVHPEFETPTFADQLQNDADTDLQQTLTLFKILNSSLNNRGKKT